MAAKLKEDPFNPDRWHSITVEVKMGTMSTEKMVPSIGIVHYTMGKIERLSTRSEHKDSNYMVMIPVMNDSFIVVLKLTRWWSCGYF